MPPALSAEWTRHFTRGGSHGVALLFIGNADARRFHAIEAPAIVGSLREPKRQIASARYVRWALCRDT